MEKSSQTRAEIRSHFKCCCKRGGQCRGFIRQYDKTESRLRHYNCANYIDVLFAGFYSGGTAAEQFDYAHSMLAGDFRLSANVSCSVENQSRFSAKASYEVNRDFDGGDRIHRLIRLLLRSHLYGVHDIMQCALYKQTADKLKTWKCRCLYVSQRHPLCPFSSSFQVHQLRFSRYLT